MVSRRHRLTSGITILLTLLSASWSQNVPFSQGCHSLEVVLEGWIGDGNTNDGKVCEEDLGKKCDPMFYLCVDTRPRDGQPNNTWKDTNMDSCHYSKITYVSKEYSDANEVGFLSDIGTNLMNPMVFSDLKETWKQAQVYVKILDIDVLDAVAFLDEHVFVLRGLDLDEPGSGNGSARWAYPFSESVTPHYPLPEEESLGKHYEKTGSKMTISYKPVCCENYFDFDCSVFCFPQTSYTYGFYTCDPKTGEKICNPGYTNPNSDPPCINRTTTCSTHQCLNGGSGIPRIDGTCGCICAPRYTGNVCEVYMDMCHLSPCQNGGTCEGTVDGYLCHCPEGYIGQNCDVEEADPPQVIPESEGTPTYVYAVISVASVLFLTSAGLVVFIYVQRKKLANKIVQATPESPAVPAAAPAAQDVCRIRYDEMDVPANTKGAGIHCKVPDDKPPEYAAVAPGLPGEAGPSDV